MRSIGRFLLVSLVAAMVLITTAASLWSYHDTTHEVEEVFDAELAQMARVLQSLLRLQLKRAQVSPLVDSLKYQAVPDFDTGSDEEAGRFGHKYEKKLAFRVWNEAGDELLSSHSAEAELQFGRDQGFGQERIDGQRWRTFTLHDRQLQIWIKVAQRNDVRRELTGEIVRHTLLPLLLLIPALALVIGAIVRRGLSPLRRMSAQIAARTPDNLDPLERRGNPAETSVVVDALNQLLAKLAEALERERRFTADAAHELRTPLAAIRIHAQNLQAQLVQDSQPPAASIIKGVDRMAHVVEQLLTLSRLEYDQGRRLERLDLCALVQSSVADLAPQALARSQHLELHCQGPVRLDLHRAGIEILCRNLVDNASRYTPPGGRIEIRVEAETEAVQLEVCDTGPGIPAAEREQVLQRFYRLAGQTVSGSGLGLSIVRQIADQHRAELSLHDSPLGESGLCVRLRFPRPEPREV